jgi:hypothetical protein
VALARGKSIRDVLPLPRTVKAGPEEAALAAVAVASEEPTVPEPSEEAIDSDEA